MLVVGHKKTLGHLLDFLLARQLLGDFEGELVGGARTSTSDQIAILDHRLVVHIAKRNNQKKWDEDHGKINLRGGIPIVIHQLGLH